MELEEYILTASIRTCNYLLNFKKEFDLIGCIVENNWNNKKGIELRVIDIIPKT